MMVKKNVRYTLDRKFLSRVQGQKTKQGPLFKKGSYFYFYKKE